MCEESFCFEKEWAAYSNKALQINTNDVCTNLPVIILVISNWTLYMVFKRYELNNTLVYTNVLY